MLLSEHGAQTGSSSCKAPLLCNRLTQRMPPCQFAGVMPSVQVWHALQLQPELSFVHDMLTQAAAASPAETDKQPLCALPITQAMRMCQAASAIGILEASAGCSPVTCQTCSTDVLVVPRAGGLAEPAAAEQPGSP